MRVLYHCILRLLNILHDHTQEAIVVMRYYDNQESLEKWHPPPTLPSPHPNPTPQKTPPPQKKKKNPSIIQYEYVMVITSRSFLKTAGGIVLGSVAVSASPPSPRLRRLRGCFALCLGCY